VNPLEDLFPRLSGNEYQITSPKTIDYNCIAWAAGDTQQWWWPSEDLDNDYWPPGVPRERTQEAFVAAFAALGYVVCESEDSEAGYEKIALFADADGPTHAGRQLSNDRWTSKLGKLEDIEHALHNLDGGPYGAVILIMKRKTTSV
jgi:hypothetical protein